MKYIILFILYNSIHFDFGVDKIDKSNNKFSIYPYYYLKNPFKIFVSFWSAYDNTLNQILLNINCGSLNKKVYRNNIKVNIDDSVFITSNTINFFLFEFNWSYFRIIINDIIQNNINYDCDLKLWEIEFNLSNVPTNNYITNLQIFDNDKLNINFKNGYLNPIVFVDLRQENLNSKYFTNKYNLFFGGINGSLSNATYSKVVSEYDLNNGGTNWILYINSQYIELDNKLFYYINQNLNKSFSFYINFDLIYKFLDPNTKEPINGIFNLYRILNNTTNIYDYILSYNSSSTNINIILKENNNNYEIINSNGAFSGNDIKKDIGIKFLFINYNISDLYPNNEVFLVGFKNNSDFKMNNDVFYKKTRSMSNLTISSSNYKLLKHFIGNLTGSLNFNPIESTLVYLILNEYGIFLGSNFDKIDTNLIINGGNNIIISNEYILNRRFSLNDNNIPTKCITTMCMICDKNDICLYCYYNYFLSVDKSCILNTDNNKFVNEYSEQLESNLKILNSNFLNNSSEKYFEIDNFLTDIRVKNNIIFTNIKIISFKKFNFIKISYNNPKMAYTNYLLEKGNISKPFTWFIINTNTYNNKYFEIKNSTDYQLEIIYLVKNFNCSNYKNEIVYKNFNCYTACTTNYYYKPINNYKGKCINNIEKGTFKDTIKNIILNCELNCLECSMDSTSYKVNCTACKFGFILNNGSCLLNNELNCSNNKSIMEIWDNNNSHNLKICYKFCNLCKKNNGIKCFFKNLNFLNICRNDNIKVINYNTNKLNEITVNNCENFNQDGNCIKCTHGYYINFLNICIKCRNNCKECNNFLKCSSCYSGFYLYDNKCFNCSLKYSNCLECNINICINTIQPIENHKCEVENCNKCLDNKCVKCNIKFKLKDNKCILINDFFYFKNNILNCFNCNYCYINNKARCTNCFQCQKYLKFKIKYNSKEIRLYYDKYNVKFKSSKKLIKISYIQYNISVKNNYISIRNLDSDIKDSVLTISIKSLEWIKAGKFEQQKINLLDFNKKKYFKADLIKNENKEFIYSIFKIKNLKNFVENLYFIKYYTLIIYCWNFIILFIPNILFFNEISLFVLLSINFSPEFLQFLSYFKIWHIDLKNLDFLYYFKTYNIGYEVMKTLYKNNLVIGEVYSLDLEIVIILFILLIYKIIEINIKSWKSKKLEFIKNNYKYLKFISFTMFQSYIIRYYYKVIFYLDLFNFIEDIKISIFLGILINIYIIIILFYLKFSYDSSFKKNDSLIFNIFENEYTKDLHFYMNLLYFLFVLSITLFRRVFKIQIFLILLYIILKIYKWTKVYIKTNIQFLFYQIIRSVIYILIFIIFLTIHLLNIDNNQVLFLIIIIIILFLIVLDLGYSLNIVIKKLFLFINDIIKNRKFDKNRPYEIKINNN